MSGTEFEGALERLSGGLRSAPTASLADSVEGAKAQISGLVDELATNPMPTNARFSVTAGQAISRLAFAA